MKRRNLYTLILALVLGLFPALALAAEAPSKELVLRPAQAATQGSVTFRHATHAKLECAACHHKIAENPGDLKCGGCHSDQKAKKGEKSWYNAFHAAGSAHSCMGCHKALKQGPTACNKCHAPKK